MEHAKHTVLSLIKPHLDTETQRIIARYGFASTPRDRDHFNLFLKGTIIGGRVISFGIGYKSRIFDAMREMRPELDWGTEL